MDKGGIGEYDSPKVLSTTPNGFLSTLIDETGPESATYLRRVAAGATPAFGDSLKSILPTM